MMLLCYIKFCEITQAIQQFATVENGGSALSYPSDLLMLYLAPHTHQETSQQRSRNSLLSQMELAD